MRESVLFFYSYNINKTMNNYNIFTLALFLKMKQIKFKISKQKTKKFIYNDYLIK